MKLFTTLILVFIFLVECFSSTVGPWNLDSLYVAPQWETTDIAAAPGMTSIFYKSIEYKGKTVDVYAYYSAPAGEAPEGGWPALVHVHGGGGTAYPEWVKAWNDHGYACISMDLEGHCPEKDELGNRIPTPNPGPSRVGIFGDWTLPLDEQWYYHAVAQIVKAHSLLRSFPEINPDKIGISGASWGGTLTSTVMGVDTRFCFAIPVYGSGYLAGSDGNQGRVLALGSAQTNFVNANYDGSAFFNNVTYPTLWFNGTNDIHFDLTCTQRSALAVQSPAAFRYTLEMPHGNLTILNYAEPFAFADQVTSGGIPLPVIKKPQLSNNIAYVNFASEKSIRSAELLYTLDDGDWTKRLWVSASANIADTTIFAFLPDSATTIYFTATDTRGLMLSSEYLSIEKPAVDTGGPYAVTGISLSENSLVLRDGATKLLLASFSPNNATNKELTWSSSDSSVATVSSFGLITARGAGSATITVTSTDGGKTDSCNITVSAVQVEGISLPIKNIALVAGDSKQLITSFIPLNASNKKVSWTTSNPDIATVDSNGVVSAKRAGTVTIGVITAEGGFTDECTVNVSNVPATGVIVFPYRLSMLVGDIQQLSATVSPANAFNKRVNWSSSDTSVAKVDTSGMVSAKSPGLSMVTASCEDGGYSDSSPVTVNHFPCTGISASPDSLFLVPGDTIQLNAVISPDEASYQGISWSSSNTSVATVDSGGLVKALGAGFASITVKSEDGGCTDKCELTVSDIHSGINQMHINSFTHILSNCIGAEVEIYNILGMMLSKNVVVGNEYRLEMNGFSSGIYIVRILNKGTSFTQKLYKQFNY